MAYKITVTNYLLTRLYELGVKHIFGVPGDYNLSLLDQVIAYQKVEWIGACNELNGAYACDAYARLNGMSALVTTYGVGELSAINGIAGAFAERVPIVNIVGIPSTSVIAKKVLVHHTTGENNFEVFADIYKHVTHAQAVLTLENAAKEIDRVLLQCWLRKRPVYIAIPIDVACGEIDAPTQSLRLEYPESNDGAIHECIERIYTLLTNAKKPMVLIDVAADRYCMKELIAQFLEVTGLPFAAMVMAKGLIDETHPQFVGIYCGKISSSKEVQANVEQSDCIISFGEFLSDLNSGGFTVNLDVTTHIKINSLYTEVQYSLYNKVVYSDLIPALLARLGNYKFTGKIVKASPISYSQATTNLFNQDRFWEIIAFGLNNKPCNSGYTIVADIGTSFFGALHLQLPKNTKFIAQVLWASIGYSVGALLGACMADPKRKAIMFVGDGAFQLTAQEISTIMRHNLKPLIFLINNDGYTIERYVQSPTMDYQNIKTWDYSSLPKVFGDNCVSIKVTTEKQLADVLERYLIEDQMYFIEICLEQMDAPYAMKKFFNH